MRFWAIFFAAGLALVGTGCHPDAAPPAGAAGPPLRLVKRPADGACAYVSAAGDTLVPFGRYSMSTTERFGNVAVVFKPGVGWVGIDRRERVLFQAFIFDNGPDYFAEGLMRVRDAAGRIGYADSASGRVVVPTRYEAAFPFAQGRARVGRRCRLVSDGEHSRWKCAEWYYIDHQGRTVPAPPGQ